MKKLFMVSILILSIVACKKTQFSPEGPIDVRVQNLSLIQILYELLLTLPEVLIHLEILMQEACLNMSDSTKHFQKLR